MAEEKSEAHLNQGFYGPSIPPSQSDDIQSRTSDKFSAYSLLCISIRTITIIIIIVGIIVLILWLVFQPQSLKAYAEDASLTTFNLSGPGNSTLFYKLSVSLSFRNPNKKYSFYYERMNALAIYDGYQFSSDGSPRLFQNRKSWLPLNVSFDGQSTVLKDSEKQSYYRERDEGFFTLNVRLFTTVRLKMILIKSAQFKPDVDCYLSLPVPGNATSLAVGFSRSECDVNNFS